MKLSQRDIAQIQGRHTQRIRHQLQREFSGEGPESDLRRRYFDSFIALVVYDRSHAAFPSEDPDLYPEK